MELWNSPWTLSDCNRLLRLTGDAALDTFSHEICGFIIYFTLWENHRTKYFIHFLDVYRVKVHHITL